MALIGESAHLFPPIGAQGLNLTLRDIANLVDCLEGVNLDEPDEIARALETLRAPARPRHRPAHQRHRHSQPLAAGPRPAGGFRPRLRADLLLGLRAAAPRSHARGRDAARSDAETDARRARPCGAARRARGLTLAHRNLERQFRAPARRDRCWPICARSSPTSCACRSSNAWRSSFRASKWRRRAITSRSTARRAIMASPFSPRRRWRSPIGLPGDESDAQSRYIEAVIPWGATVLRVGCLYLPNGNPLGTEKYAYKLAWMDRLIAHAKKLLAYEERLVLCGDYNVIPDARDVYDPAAWLGDALLRAADARRNSANCWRSALPTPCARPPTPTSNIRSGIIRRAPGRRTRACASTICCCRRRPPTGWRAWRSTATCGRRTSPRTTCRSGWICGLTALRPCGEGGACRRTDEKSSGPHLRGPAGSFDVHFVADSRINAVSAVLRPSARQS